jgi:hypothetical protein
MKLNKETVEKTKIIFIEEVEKMRFPRTLEEFKEWMKDPEKTK